MKRPASSLSLTPRDVQIVQMVYDYGGCGIAHIHKRLWPQGSAQAAAYRRVALLTAARYLRTHRLPALIPQGSGKALITPGVRAQALPLSINETQPLTRFRRSHEISAFFAEHHFAICDFRVALEEASASLTSVEIAAWVLESSLKHGPIRITDLPGQNKGKTGKISLIPDGAFSLRLGKQEQVAYLEMDMGTISHPRLERRLRGYLLLNRDSRQPVPVFFVTTTAERVKRVVNAIAAQAERVTANPTTIFVASAQDIAADTLLTRPIWHRAGTQASTAILPDRILHRDSVQTALDVTTTIECHGSRVA